MRPVPYVPFPPGDDTDTTDGGAASIPMSLEWPSDPLAPGSGSVRLAALPAASLMPPPSEDSESVPV